MTELAFLSPDRAVTRDGFEPRLASPLARGLAGDERVRDLSGIGKIEVRGRLDRVEFPYGVEVVRITPERALLLCSYADTASVRAELREQLRSVIDMTGALAGLELEGEQAMRRLTDLDLDALPAAGKVAEVPALVLRNGDRFRIFFPQELGHYLSEVVLDTLDGLL